MQFIPNFFRIIFLLALIPCSCIKGQGVDTINIYKNKTNIGYSGYWKEWFTPKRFLYKSNFSYSYSLGSRFTHQDSIIMAPHHPMYYKVYGKGNRVIMEGQTDRTEEELSGEIKYFYRTGNLKRAENWCSGDQPIRDSCGGGYVGYDMHLPIGIWTYYRKKGSILKTVNYIILPCEHKNKTSCYWVAQTTKYNRKGKKGKITEKRLEEI
jgi:hypothetical protein